MAIVSLVETLSHRSDRAVAAKTRSPVEQLTCVPAHVCQQLRLSKFRLRFRLGFVWPHRLQDSTLHGLLGRDAYGG